MVKAKILVAEDDKSMALLLEHNLNYRGYKTTLCYDGESGLQAFRQGKYDLCILDVMLPRMDGFQLARTLKSENKGIPVIFLTAKSFLQHKIEGFGLGADDYITKPFDMEELALRIEAVLGRTRGETESTAPSSFMEEISIGPLHFNYTLRLAKVGQDEFLLSAKEAELLNILLEHRNKLVPRQLILETIWKEDNFFTAQSMYVYLTRIRKLIKGNPHLQLQNVHGAGYIMVVME